MSFILDALNKSETERQRQRDPAAVVVPTALPKKNTPVIFWVLGAILLANTAVILYVMWPDRATTRPAAVIQPADSRQLETVPLTAAITDSEVRSLSATAVTDGEVRSLSTEMATPAQAERSETSVARSAPRPAPAVTARSARSDGNNVPSLAELVLSGSMQPMTLHVDVHVYHPERRSRFVVLNSKRYREGDRISEGPVLEAITPDGAVLAHNGRRFSITNDR